MRKIKLICGAVIVGGFFLPWLDMGEKGEMMSEHAAMAGGEVSTTFSGYKLATGGAGMPGKYVSPTLYAIPLLGILVVLVNSRAVLFIGSIGAIGVMLLNAPVPINSAMAGDVGMTGWAYGKILSFLGLIAIMFTGSTDDSNSQATTNTQATPSKDFYE